MEVKILLRVLKSILMRTIEYCIFEELVGKSPVYTHTVPGTYTVNLTINNANGIVSKLDTIIVTAVVKIIQEITEVSIAAKPVEAAVVGTATEVVMER